MGTPAECEDTIHTNLWAAMRLPHFKKSITGYVRYRIFSERTPVQQGGERPEDLVPGIHQASRSLDASDLTS